MRALTLAAAGVAALGLAACSSSDDDTMAFYFESHDSTSFTLQDVYDDTADRVVIVCPYDTEESVKKALGTEWAEAGDFEQDESQNAIVALKDGEVASTEVLSRTSLDACSTGTKSGRVLPLGTRVTVVDESSTGGARFTMRFE